MSYILDALKKSERERGHGSVPSVQTIHTAGLDYKNEKKQIWPYFLIGAVILNMAALLFFMMSGDETTPALAIQKEVVEESDPETVVQVTDAVPPQTAVPTSPVVAESAPAIEPTWQPETTVASLDVESSKHTTQSTQPEKYFTSETITLHELPTSIQQLFPSVTFQAHVYSTNPAQRSVVINDRFMEEGEYVLDGLVISEITPDGVIFGFMGYKISSGVISNWNIN